MAQDPRAEVRDVARAHGENEIIGLGHSAIAANGGRLIKTLGDEVLYAADD
ncbi:hypothetical protein GTW43_00535, partial [Streptomyces sp. SID5785]|nr:hypothetical protein [Streptomyces sp. SID5785]